MPGEMIAKIKQAENRCASSRDLFFLGGSIRFFFGGETGVRVSNQKKTNQPTGRDFFYLRSCGNRIFRLKGVGKKEKRRNENREHMGEEKGDVNRELEEGKHGLYETG